MKKTIIIVLLFIFSGAAKLSAQDRDSVVILPSITVRAGTIVSAEVNKAFRKAFPEGKKLKWYNLNKDYLAKFIENDMKQHALFSKEGNMIYNVSYGYEKNLPEAVRSKITETYPDYKITNTANVKQSNRDIWVINMESVKSIMIVRYEDGEVGEIDSYKKSM